MNTLTHAEISTQATALAAARQALEDSQDWIQRTIGNPEFDEIVFIGSGSSYYQAMVMATTAQKWLNKPAVAHPSSEIYLFRDHHCVPHRRYLLVGVSRSGESTEALLALNSVKDVPNWTCCGITCYSTSQMAALVDCLVSPLGAEQSTVMTKSFSSMTWMMQRAIAMASQNQRAIADLDQAISSAEQVVQRAAPFAESIIQQYHFENYVYLGMGTYFGLAQEAMLKLKEMSNVWVESYGTLEFRHGPKSIVVPGSLVCVLVSQTARAFELKVAEEMKEYGAIVLLVTAQSGSDTAFADFVFDIGHADISDEARSVLYLPLVQYFGCGTAVQRGLNPDEPRNLTQVVRL